jgi:hypothetical protein
MLPDYGTSSLKHFYIECCFSYERASIRALEARDDVEELGWSSRRFEVCADHIIKLIKLMT